MRMVLKYWVLLLFCFCRSSRGSSSTYTKPICEDDNGFYCPPSHKIFSSYSCPPRSQRCASYSDDCSGITEPDCGYNPATKKFAVYRHSTPLKSFDSISKRDIPYYLNCLRYEVAHHFITYRGLMYEFGSGYSFRVQDPNDPCYEYRANGCGGPGRSSTRTMVGESSCTYEQVLEFGGNWTTYKLCSHNCQDFAKGLEEHLVGGCKVTDPNPFKYISNLAKNGSCTLARSGSLPNAPLQFAFFFTVTFIGIFTMVHENAL